MISGHGDDLYAYKGKVKHNFSSNILSGVEHSGMLDELVKRGGMVSNYPQPVPYDLEKRLAKHFGVRLGTVIVTNGATEAIYLMAHAFDHAKSAIVVPTFSEYEDACKLYHHDIQYCTELKEDTTGINIVWLCNPNNPTGKTMNHNALVKIIEKNPETTFVIDGAYSDYTDSRVLNPEEIVELDNAVLLGSFTKRFSVPGLRLGYMVASERITDRVLKYRMPWSVSGPAIMCADYLLDHIDEYPIHAEELHKEVLRISHEFRQIGITTSDTDCNFILCKLPQGTAAQLKEYLVENHGILIRDASNFRMLDESYFRVAAQTDEENDLLISAVKQWIML